MSYACKMLVMFNCIYTDTHNIFLSRGDIYIYTDTVCREPIDLSIISTLFKEHHAQQHMYSIK